MGRVLTLAVLLFSLTAAAAAQTEDDPRRLSARIAVNLFAKTCLANMADPAKAVVTATTEVGLAELPPDFAVPFLMGRPGAAFSGAVDSAGFVLALPEDGLCLIYAQIADPVEIGGRFRAVMADLSDDTFDMRPSGETETDGRISRAWDLVPAGSHLKKLKAKFGKRDFPALFEVGLTTAPPGGLFEAVLSTASKVVPKDVRRPD